MPGQIPATPADGSSVAPLDVYLPYCRLLSSQPATDIGADEVSVLLVPVHTLAALVCLNSAGVPSHWLSLCPQTKRCDDTTTATNGSTAPVEITTDVRVLCDAPTSWAVASVRLPAAWCQRRRLCVAGLCAVVRSCVRQLQLADSAHLPASQAHYWRRDSSLLGFRRGCLAPPADVSPWTAFVERDWPAAVSVAATSAAHEDTVPPAVLVRLERHLQRPLRVHNVWKQEQDAAKMHAGGGNGSAVLDDASDGGHARRGDSNPVADCGTAKSTRLLQEATRGDVSSRSTQMNSISSNIRDGLNLKADLSSQANVTNKNEDLHRRRVGGRECVGGWREGDHLVAGRLRHVRHRFAEGHVLTITDLLLYPCVGLLLRRLAKLNSDWLHTVAPCVAAWLRTLEQQAPALPATCRRLLGDWQLLPVSQPPTPAIPAADETGVAQEEECLTQTEYWNKQQVASLYRKDTRGSGFLLSASSQRQLDEIMTRLQQIAASNEDGNCWPHLETHPGSGRLQLPWQQLPAWADPSAGQLPVARAQRKRQQLESVLWLVRRLAQPHHVLVDFCSGGGHVGVAVAAVVPCARVVLLENKSESLARAERRLASAAQEACKVAMIQCDMAAFGGEFHVGVAVHACGLATDQVIARCVQARAAFVVCPCCYGAVGDGRVGCVAYPRSQQWQRVMSFDDWLVLAHAADRNTSAAPHADTSKNEQGRRCMELVDADRLLAAVEANYSVMLTQAEPAHCSPKNHLLVGVPPHWPHALADLLRQ